MGKILKSCNGVRAKNIRGKCEWGSKIKIVKERKRGERRFVDIILHWQTDGRK